jgi:hypothetical protein
MTKTKPQDLTCGDLVQLKEPYQTMINAQKTYFHQDQFMGF